MLRTHNSVYSRHRCVRIRRDREGKKAGQRGGRDSGRSWREVLVRAPERAATSMRAEAPHPEQ